MVMDPRQDSRYPAQRPETYPTRTDIRPGFQFWQHQKQGAILWILAHLVYYRTQHPHPLTPTDYADFMGALGGKRIKRRVDVKTSGITW